MTEPRETETRDVVAADVLPSVAEAIRRLPVLLERKIETDAAVARAQIGAGGSVARWALVVTALVVALVLAAAVVLVVEARLSSDAAAVVLGAAIGGVFGLPRWVAARAG